MLCKLKESISTMWCPVFIERCLIATTLLISLPWLEIYNIILYTELFWNSKGSWGLSKPLFFWIADAKGAAILYRCSIQVAPDIFKLLHLEQEHCYLVLVKLDYIHFKPKWCNMRLAVLAKIGSRLIWLAVFFAKNKQTLKL